MNFFSSISHAIRGMLLAFKTERSFRIQIACAIIALIASCIFPISSTERYFILLAVSLVLVLELVNSMVERLVDLVKPRLHEYARDIKDLMAAAVFMAALFAFVLGILVFWPYILPFFVSI